MPELKIVSMTYKAADLEAWKDGDYTAVLGATRKWQQAHRLLASKAQKRRDGRLDKGHARGDARFFGEAIALKGVTGGAWYGSFKWLTSARATHAADRTDAPGSDLHDALRAQFPNEMECLQAMANRLSPRLPRTNAAGFRKPVAPDLWLTSRDGRHRFAEVKLSDRRDTVGPTQLAGLAVIATCLGAAHRVSTEIISLSCEGNEAGGDFAREQKQFQKFCDMLKAQRTRTR